MAASDVFSTFDLLLGSVTLAAIALLVYHHAGYPLILRRAGRRALPVPPPVPDDALPHVTIVVPAYNEAAVIAAKIDNLRALDYPADRLDVIVACDGCSDTTAGVASAAATLEPVLDALHRNYWRVTLSRRHAEGALGTDWMAALGIAETLASELARFDCFGAFWQAIERSSPSLRRHRLHPDALPVEILRARGVLGWLRQQSAEPMRIAIAS